MKQAAMHVASCEDQRDATVLLEHRFLDDHSRLDRMSSNAALLAARRSFVTAAKAWGEMRILQERHMNLEEELLAAIESEAGVTPSMDQAHAAHREIRAAADAVAQALSRWDLPAFEAAHERISKLLAQHCRHELTVLVPELRALLGRQKVRDRLFRSMVRD